MALKAPLYPTKFRSMPRRRAYKILAVQHYWSEFNQARKELGLPDILKSEQILQVIERIGSTKSEFKKMVKTPIYSKDKLRRAMHKADLDVYHRTRRPHTWRRYKIGQNYRKNCPAEINKLHEELDQFVDCLNDLTQKLSTFGVKVTA